jgi:hypothetical protein
LPTTTTLFDHVVDFLDRDGWSPTVEDGYITCGFQGDNGHWPVYATVIEDEQRVIFYSLLTEHVPDQSRRDVTELFIRINFNLLVGSFDLDLDDGEARFRTSLDIEGGELTDGLLRQVIYANVTTMDEYLPALRGVSGTMVTVSEALATIE